MVSGSADLVIFGMHLVWGQRHMAVDLKPSLHQLHRRHRHR